MPYKYVAIYLDDFDDEDLIKELECRGFKVHEPDQEPEDDRELAEIFWRFKAGYIEDALTLLERKYPDLYGISKLTGGK